MQQVVSFQTETQGETDHVQICCCIACVSLLHHYPGCSPLVLSALFFPRPPLSRSPNLPPRLITAAQLCPASRSQDASSSRREGAGDLEFLMGGACTAVTFAIDCRRLLLSTLDSPWSHGGICLFVFCDSADSSTCVAVHWCAVPQPTKSAHRSLRNPNNLGALTDRKPEAHPQHK